MGEEPTSKISPWLLIALIVVVVGAAAFFYFNSRKNVSTDIVATPTVTAQPSTSSNAEELNSINSDLNNLDSDLNQLNKVDASATEDVAPTL